MKAIVLTLLIAVPMSFLSTKLHSQEFNVYNRSLIQANDEGVAIGGYDPVAFFLQDAAVVGQAQYSCSYQGKTWHFSSEENRDKFLSSPESFTPEYGGFCAHSLGKGTLVEANPEAFLIRDEKLYFYANNSFRDREKKKTKIDFGDLTSKRKANWSKFKYNF